MVGGRDIMAKWLKTYIKDVGKLSLQYILIGLAGAVLAIIYYSIIGWPEK